MWSPFPAVRVGSILWGQPVVQWGAVAWLGPQQAAAPVVSQGSSCALGSVVPGGG